MTDKEQQAREARKLALDNIDRALETFLDDFQMDDGESQPHDPTEFEKLLIADAIRTFLVEEDFLEAWGNFMRARAPSAQEPIGYFNSDLLEEARLTGAGVILWSKQSDDNDRALAYAAPVLAGVPEGWPTTEMVKAAREVFGEHVENTDSDYERILRAALAAAPTPPQAQDARRLQAMAAEWDLSGSDMPIWDALCDAIARGANGSQMREAIDAAIKEIQP